MTYVPLITLLAEADEGHAEVEPCYQPGCNIDVTRPAEYEQFCEALRQLGMFLQFVVVPNAAI